MRGLEERLRLALEGTETGFWEWHVDTDVDRVVRQHGPDLRPAARHPAGRRRRLPGASCSPTIARRWAGASRPRSSTARRTRWTCASCCPTRACAGCTRGPARSHRRAHGAHHRPAERRHRAPPARGRARVPRRRQPGPGVVDGPGGDARGGRAARRPRARGLVLGPARRPSARSRSPTSTPRRSAGRTSCRSATRPTPTRRPARPP